MQKAAAVLRLIRPINCLMMGVAVLVGIIVANQGKPPAENMALRIPLSFVTGFVFLAAANTINDYYDRKIDAVNEPNRPIPSGAVSPREALSYVAILSATGFIAALFTSLSNFIIAAVAWILFTYYATKGKRTGILGNLIVSACIAIPFIYGGFAVEKGLTSLTILFTATAFLSTVGREITKGILDVEGDRLQGVRTLAVLQGPRTAAIIADLFYVAAVAFSLLPLLLSEVSFWYLPLIIVADAGFLSSSISLFQNHSRENARRVKEQARIWMVIGLLAFVAGVFGRG